MWERLDGASGMDSYASVNRQAYRSNIHGMGYVLSSLSSSVGSVGRLLPNALSIMGIQPRELPCGEAFRDEVHSAVSAVQ